MYTLARERGYVHERESHSLAGRKGFRSSLTQSYVSPVGAARPRSQVDPGTVAHHHPRAPLDSWWRPRVAFHVGLGICERQWHVQRTWNQNGRICESGGLAHATACSSWRMLLAQRVWAPSSSNRRRAQSPFMLTCGLFGSS